uniref:Uncharacterized protein n=1 Tax=viral metagenome TaxID=1070528 RepID=A0A6C0B0F1_9ZZZZ
MDEADIIISDTIINNQIPDAGVHHNVVINDDNINFNNYLFLMVGFIAWYYYFAL